MSNIHKSFAWNQGKLPISYLYGMMIVYALAAWFSEGFLHADEHYQILEFAAYHIHHYPYEYPWELAAQIRPTLQIWAVIWLSKMVTCLPWQMSPFMVAFLTRLVSGLLSAVVILPFLTEAKSRGLGN